MFGFINRIKENSKLQRRCHEIISKSDLWQTAKHHPLFVKKPKLYDVTGKMISTDLSSKYIKLANSGIELTPDLMDGLVVMVIGDELHRMRISVHEIWQHRFHAELDGDR